MKHIFPLFVLSFFIIIFTANAQDHTSMVSGPFENAHEVTETCIMCHDGAAQDLMQTTHWTWLGPKFEDENGDSIRLGKKSMMNNFCIAVSSNQPRCTSCHTGYGWKDANFDFEDPKNIDCLICHDQSGQYKKTPTGAGYPAEDVDLVKAAQSVGSPTRDNCGVCHFNGGGGTGVKHGDLDDSMYEPSPSLDVHMGMLGFQCTECHTTENHEIAGASHASMAADRNHISCMNCHGEEVHSKSILNKHVASVACETCHIPEFAREQPTKMWWDWSDAGKDLPAEKDEYGKKIFIKKKGSFRWEKNVEPEYAWFDGSADYYRFGDKIDPSGPVKLNKVNGSIDDPDSKISPFKVIRGKQPYDTGNKMMIVPHLYGEGGYWKIYDWNKAAETGMKSVGLEYSGNYGFVETEMYWTIDHMVAPADDAVKCTDCHGVGEDKRLDWKKLGYEADPMKTGGRKVN